MIPLCARERDRADRLVAAGAGRADRQVPAGRGAARWTRGPRASEMGWAIERLHARRGARRGAAAAADRRRGRADDGPARARLGAARRNVAAAIIGASRPEQVDDNAAASGVKLSDDPCWGRSTTRWPASRREAARPRRRPWSLVAMLAVSASAPADTAARRHGYGTISQHLDLCPRQGDRPARRRLPQGARRRQALRPHGDLAIGRWRCALAHSDLPQPLLLRLAGLRQPAPGRSRRSLAQRPCLGPSRPSRDRSPARPSAALAVRLDHPEAAAHERVDPAEVGVGAG